MFVFAADAGEQEVAEVQQRSSDLRPETPQHHTGPAGTTQSHRGALLHFLDRPGSPLCPSHLQQITDSWIFRETVIRDVVFL